MKIKSIILAMSGAALLAAGNTAFATCAEVSWANLKSAVSYAAGLGSSTGGYGLNMWATVVDESGKVCWVATSGTPGALAGNSEWLGSRVISAQKAFTANAFSLNGYAISTANLYEAVKNGSLYGLQFSNPVDSSLAYVGSPAKYGTMNDPLVGKRIGGVNVFGGGLALYMNGVKIGALGVSGDTSCRDHAFAWNVRSKLGLQPMVGKGGTAPGITTSNVNAAGAAQTPLTGAKYGDELIISSPSSIATDAYWNNWAQPACPNSTSAATAANGTLMVQ